LPNADNTGVPAGTTLTPSGSLTISTAGAVVAGRDIVGRVTVNAPNVTIRNSRIHNSVGYAIYNQGNQPLLIEDSEISTGDGGAVGDSNYTLRRVEIFGGEHGVEAGNNVLVEDSWIHDLNTEPRRREQRGGPPQQHFAPGHGRPGLYVGDYHRQRLDPEPPRVDRGQPP
jgi:hypothetical protein